MGVLSAQMRRTSLLPLPPESRMPVLPLLTGSWHGASAGASRRAPGGVLQTSVARNSCCAGAPEAGHWFMT